MKILILLSLVFLVGCSHVTPDFNNDIGENDLGKVSEQEFFGDGPGGCNGVECMDFCNNNPEVCDEWCLVNPERCEGFVDKGDFESPGDCGNNCEKYCNDNPGECQKWCEENFNKNPELCGLLSGSGAREGDGFWEKNELKFYIKDEENVLTNDKREVIRDVFFSKKESDGGFWGWNSALEELNKLYSDNKVPDVFVEVNSEQEADFVISVHSAKEFCCDYGGDPITGNERSDITPENIKLKSKIGIWNIVNIENGFLGDVMRHEVGHGIGLFGHVTHRENDLMSLISPDSEIKKPNLNDLYIKYRDGVVEDMDEARERDLEVRDSKVRPPGS